MNDRLRRRLDPSLYTQHLAATRSLSVPFSSATSVQYWAAANNRPLPLLFNTPWGFRIALVPVVIVIAGPTAPVRLRNAINA